MEQFKKLLNELTKSIWEDTTLDGHSFDLIEMSNLSNDQIQQIKLETADIELIHIDEFWDLTEHVYKILMLNTVQIELLEFFKKLQKTYTLSFVEIQYLFHPWHSFLLTLKGYSEKKELLLDTKYGEDQIQKLLHLFEIKDLSWHDDLYDFDYKFNFESEVEQAFRKLAFASWHEAKKETNAVIPGFILESNGGSHLYNLDSGDNLSEMNMSIDAYLRKQ